MINQLLQSCSYSIIEIIFHTSLALKFISS